MSAIERALELSPRDSRPNFHQGVCAFRIGRYEDAVSAFGVCIALAPDRAEGYDNGARAHEAQGHADEAARDVRRAAAIDPSLAHPGRAPTGPRHPSR